MTELVALAEAVRDSAGSKDLFQPLQPPESANRAPLDQASDGLPAEGKKQLEEIAPPGRESAADLLKKDESNAGIRQPLPHEHVADAQWALEQWGEGAFAGATKLFVAVYQQAVIDAGDDPVELATRCAGGRGVPPDRIVIKYVGPED